MVSSLRALLEQPRQLLSIAVAAVAAVLIGNELLVVLDTAIEPTVTSAARNDANVSGNPVATISEAGLFGAAATPVESGDDEGLPQSSAQLILRGVFTGQTPDQGSAIIELPDGSTRMVRAGGSLDNGVVLQRIYPGRVVLNRNGLQESLSFPTAEEYAALPESISAPASEAAAGETPAATLSDDEKRTNILRRLEELRSRSLERNQG